MGDDWFMVEPATCGQEGFLYVQKDWGLGESRKDIPAGLAEVFVFNFVEWAEECDERGRVIYSSG